MNDELTVTPADAEPLKPAKAKETIRTLEELESAPIKGMSDKEIKKYIEFLREETGQLRAQLQTLKDAFTGVQKQKAAVEQEYTAFKLAARTQISFCKETLAQAYKSVHYMAPLED